MQCTIPNTWSDICADKISSYGVAAGGEAFASSVTSAMEGVFVRVFSWCLCDIVSRFPQMKPIEGAESEGAFGFFKGVGKGLVG